MAEWRGFEPPDPVIEINALAVRRIQPALPPLHIILVDRSGVESNHCFWIFSPAHQPCMSPTQDNIYKKQ